LPVYWHGDLHMEVRICARKSEFLLFFFQSKATGVDEQLSHLTLPSVAKLRTFINNTLSDILFYTSPVYCQVEIQSILNSVYYCFS